MSDRTDDTADRDRTDDTTDRERDDYTADRDDGNPRNDNHHAGRDVLNTDAMKWVSALAALVGLWIAASPFVYEATDVAFWNNMLVGAGIFLLAGYNFVRMARDRLASVGAASLTVLLGLWVAVSPFVIAMEADGLVSSTIVSGLVVAVLSAYNAYANSKADVPAHRGART